MRRFHTGLIGSNKSRDGFGAAANDRHFRDVEFDARHFDQLIDRRTGGEQGRQSVRLGLVVNIVSADDFAGARHVFDDEGWIAGYVARQMAHHQSSDDIAAAARSRSDDDTQSFALVERFGGENRRRDKKKRQYPKNRFWKDEHNKTTWHCHSEPQAKNLL